MANNHLPGMVTSLLDHRLRQLAPSFVLLTPLIFKYEEYFIGQNNNSFPESAWYSLAVLLVVLLVVSFLTETIGELVEGVIWICFEKKHHNNSYNISDEWFRYLKRDTKKVLIADKYLGSLVDRMLLKSALVVPFFIIGICFSISEREACTKIVTLTICWSLSALFLYASIRNQRELIRLRKSIIRKE